MDHTDSPLDDLLRSPAALFRVAVNIAVWMCLLGVMAILTLQFVDNPSIRVAVLQSFTPWMPAAALAAVATACVIRADRAGATGSAVALVSLAAVTPVAWADDLPDPIEGATPFEVVAANVLFSNDRIDAVGDVLVDLDADVIALVEITPVSLSTLDAHPLADRYPHRIDRPGSAASGLAIWSRHPLTALPDAGFGPRVLEASVQFPDGPVRVVAAHPPPPVANRNLWLREVANIPAIADGGDRVVVLGDFNSSWFHPPFRRAVDDAGLVNAAAATGDGLAMTWPSHGLIPAFVAIDHVLFGDGLTALDSDVVAIPGSDHHAVVAELAVSE